MRRLNDYYNSGGVRFVPERTSDPNVLISEREDCPARLDSQHSYRPCGNGRVRCVACGAVHNADRLKVAA